MGIKDGVRDRGITMSGVLSVLERNLGHRSFFRPLTQAQREAYERELKKIKADITEIDNSINSARAFEPKLVYSDMGLHDGTGALIAREFYLAARGCWIQSRLNRQ